MKFASLCAEGQFENRIFQLDHPTNRDNCHYPYWLLKKAFLKVGIEINTSDANAGKNVSFELHQDVQKQICNVPAYVMLLESPVIRPNDQLKNLLMKYRLVFTWNDNLVDGYRYLKLNTPNSIIVNDSRGWMGRERLCCMIAGNKTSKRSSPLELYSERVKAIRWFEHHAPEDFDLFGTGWDAPVARPGLLGNVFGRLQRQILNKSGKIYFPSYRGRVFTKRHTLQKYRFSICYENIRDVPGYITEKIFDSFFAGCIPVYWGASNINNYIPESCYVDRRKLSSYLDLYQFIFSMTESEYIGYQERISAFLSSEQAYPFSADSFVDTICTEIVRDLGITA